MIDIKGFTIQQKIYEGSSTLIFKAVRESDTIPVVIKLLKREYPTIEELHNFEHEFSVARGLAAVEGIITNYSMMNYRHSKAIVLEDFGAVSLDKIMQSLEIDLKTFLKIAVRTTSILGDIHSRHIIHKDIKPHNILYNPATGEVKIIDFGISTRLSRQMQSIVNPSRLEGTLAYISPEQTGRMNRSLDYRSDFYSLGVTFYEMLTGSLPFEASDPLELVHCHIAKHAQSPDKKNSSVPPGLAKIVMKLLEKTAENRYQSVRGLLADLTACSNLLEENGTIGDFEVGLSDHSESFFIPEKLYGRKMELNLLASVFEQAALGSKEIIYFCGEPGIGKSVLIKEVHKPIVEKRGFFISGKYDQFKKNIPYSAVIQAFCELINQLLSENEQVLTVWKKKIEKTLGTNCNVICEVLPALELIVGKQGPPAPLPPLEAQNRFTMVFRSFVSLFASPAHPLVLFLDDLQWIDQASLALMETILCDRELTFFLFIGSYRDTEVSKGHPFQLSRDRLARENIGWEEVKLWSLSLDDINHLVSDSLGIEENRTRSLSALIEQKTRGNPFFVHEFFANLYEQELLYFENGWQWDVEQIKEAEITGNVVELMSQKIGRLEESHKQLLFTCACIGNRFTLESLGVITEKSPAELDEALNCMVREGLVLQLGSIHCFVHDRVHEAAYCLMAKDEAARIHYRIGTHLLHNARQEGTLEEQMFNIVNQWNECIYLLNQAQKEELLELNLFAGKRAIEAAAYVAALQFFTVSFELLPADSWKTCYGKTLEIYLALGETNYLCTRYEEAENLLEEARNRAQNAADTIDALIILIRSHVAQNQPMKALATGKAGIALLGFKVPEKLGTRTMNNSLKTIHEKMSSINLEERLHAEKSSSGVLISFSKLFDVMMSVTFLYRPHYYLALTLKLLNLTIELGSSEKSPICFMMYAMILVNRGMFEDAERIGDFAYRLSFRFSDRVIRSKNSFILNASRFWHTHPDEIYNQFVNKALPAALEAGDLEYGSYDYLYGLITLFVSRSPLKECLEWAKSHFSALVQLKQEITNINFLLVQQGIHNLMNMSKEPTVLKGKYCDEFEIFSREENLTNNNMWFYYAIPKLVLNYLLGDCKNSLRVINKIDENEMTFCVQSFYLFVKVISFVNIAKMYKNSGSNKEQQQLCLKKMKAYMKKAERFCGLDYQLNYNKYFLMAAEYVRLTGRKVETAFNEKKALFKSPEKMYDLAIEGARENGFLIEEALANECAAEYYLKQGLEKIAALYAREAIYCFDKWGCPLKVEQMSKRFASFLNLVSSGAAEYDPRHTLFSMTTTTCANRSSDGTGSSDFLDLDTIMKACQAIISEIKLDRVLTNLIKILIENAGAGKGALIFSEKTGLVVGTECDIEGRVRVLENTPVDKAGDLCPAIIRYVAKTEETVILADASQEGTFIKDPYITENGIKSVLCLPVINQGRLTAILYLENNLTDNAFTEGRVEMLRLLSIQAAISIENSMLIKGLTEQERLKKEMEIAKQIQMSLAPPLLPQPDLEISASMNPADEVGGDYYDIVNDRFGRLWFAIGDVCGHGLVSGLIMMMAQSSLGTAVNSNESITPAGVLDLVNRLLCANTRDRLNKENLMTLTVFEYQGEGKVVYSGLHLDILIYRKAEDAFEIIETGGVYLGIRDDIDYELVNSSFILNRGDILFLYSDGIIEARPNGGPLWDLKGLMNSIKNRLGENLKKIKEGILADARLHSKGKQNDDMTLMLIRRK